VSHPRDVFGYEGGEAQEQALLDAMARGRLHHAWLLTGPEGVGKATFAYRAARRLLGAVPSPAHGLLGASPEDPVSRQVAARSHPDLLVLERDLGDGKARRNITVDEARTVAGFFANTPASAPYRVAIIDAADDLNANAANAVLKTLEEPPPRGVLFLVSHAPGKLLPTIRSRCRRLAFGGWSEGQVADFITRHTGVVGADADALAAMSRGAPGRALALASEGALDLDRAAHDLLRSLPAGDETAQLALAESFRGAEGARRFELLFERLSDQVRTMAVHDAAHGKLGGLDRWGQAWERLQVLPAQVEGLNLDRAEAFWTAMAELRQASRVRC
jgi:DNA polymerase-3 subunit delta'